MQANQKPWVVVDTNVWLSALIFGGSPGKILELFIDGAILVAVSEELLSELRRKITEKFPLYLPQLGLLEASIRQDAVLVELGARTVNISRDSDDNKFIETALIGGCGYIISGDKDLLTIGGYQGVQIVTPAAFLAIMQS